MTCPSAAQRRPHRHGVHVHAHPHAGRHRHLRHPRRSAAPEIESAIAGPLANRTYRRLYVAQIVALVGTGVSTVALGLLAYDLAGANAGTVLGAALALKMVAYVGLSPLIAAFAHRVDRRRLLVTLDITRALVMFTLPFVTQVWQVFVLILVVNACAAGFTPTFQATIPDVLPDERDYTRALSFSRLAYDLEELLSPAIAAGLLLLVGFQSLFALNGVAFVCSALLLLSVRLPTPTGAVSDRTWDRITLGVRRYLRTPRLRGLLALSLAAAAASAMTIVNTVILVRNELHASSSAVAVALTVAGAGSIATALTLPRLLERVTDRAAMLTGGTLLSGGLLLVPAVTTYATLLPVWFALGVGLALVQTPAGRLIQRTGTPAERPALFAAQFSLSHACWLVTYPLAGILGAAVGTAAIGIVLAVVAGASTLAAALLWRPHPVAA